MVANERVIIAGGPRTGKTTLAKQIAKRAGVEVRHTDDLIDTTDWSGASAKASAWFDAPGPWVVEGVATPRALRKWLARSEGKPADRIIWLGKAKVPCTPGQTTMGKGCRKVWDEVLPALWKAGVTIETDPHFEAE